MVHGEKWNPTARLIFFSARFENPEQPSGSSLRH